MTGIYPLPEKPSALDIIERSIIAHPSLFAETLDLQAAEHKRYAANLANGERAKQGALASARACDAAAYHIRGEGGAAQIVKDCGQMVIALNVACKLQCLPAHIRTAAAVMWEQEQ